MPEVTLTSRAEVAMRSLGAQEEKAVLKVFDYLKTSSAKQAWQSHKVLLLKSQPPGEIYIFRATQKFRLILTYSEAGWTVEDILHHDRLDRLQVGGRP